MTTVPFRTIVATVASFLLAAATAGFAAAPASADEPTQSCWVDVWTGANLCVAAGEDIVAAGQDEYGIQVLTPGEQRDEAQGTRLSLGIDNVVTVAVLYDGAGVGAPEFLVTEGV